MDVTITTVKKMVIIMESNLEQLKQIQQQMEQPSPFFERVNALLIQILPHRATAQQIADLFNLHNEMFSQIKEHSTFCDTCRARVFKRMQRWHVQQLEIIDRMKIRDKNNQNDGDIETVGHVVVPEPEILERPKRGRKKKTPPAEQ